MTPPAAGLATRLRARLERAANCLLVLWVAFVAVVGLFVCGGLV